MLKRLETVSLELGEYPIDGASSVLDGDTIRVKGLPASLRLLGIDTEETFKKDKERAAFAAGAGADDYSDQGEEWQVLSEVSAMDAVVKALEDAKIPVKSSYPGYVPKNKKTVTGRDAELCLNLAEALDDHDDAQNVYADFDVPEEELAKMAD